MEVHLADLRMDSWQSITRDIEAGVSPKKEIIAALKRGEPVILAPKVQHHIAKLLTRKTNGRPKKRAIDKTFSQIWFLETVGSLSEFYKSDLDGGLERALQTIATRRSSDTGTVRRDYNAAIKNFPQMRVRASWLAERKPPGV
jgi:hypothetical protein